MVWHMFAGFWARPPVRRYNLHLLLREASYPVARSVTPRKVLTILGNAAVSGLSREELYETMAQVLILSPEKKTYDMQLFAAAIPTEKPSDFDIRSNSVIDWHTLALSKTGYSKSLDVAQVRFVTDKPAERAT